MKKKSEIQHDIDEVRDAILEEAPDARGSQVSLSFVSNPNARVVTVTAAVRGRKGDLLDLACRLPGGQPMQLMSVPKADTGRPPRYPCWSPCGG